MSWFTASRKTITNVVEKALLGVALYAAVVAWAMAETPQSFVAGWYARGGLARTIQVIATDVLGPRGVIVATLVLLAAYVGPRRILHLAGLGARFVRKHSTKAAALVVVLAIAVTAFTFRTTRAPHATSAEHLNVLVLVVDSLSADRLDPGIAPNLTKLATRGTRFDRAYVSAPPTKDSDVAASRFAAAGYSVTTSTAHDFERKLRSLDGRPFFTTVEFSQAAFPYASPAPYYRRYTDPRYRGRFKYDASASIAGDAATEEADRRQVEALRKGAIAAVDDTVEQMLGTLDRLALADRTIVVVIGNQRDSRIDDATKPIAFAIYDPRVVRKENAKGRGEVVRDVDLAPTLLDLVGIAPPPKLDGRSLVAALRGGRIEPGLAFAEAEATSADATGGLDPATLVARKRIVRDERFKLVYVPTRQGVRYELFDTANDPEERRDVAASHPEELARLRDALWAFLLEDPSMEQADGYLVPKKRRLGATATTASDVYEVSARLVDDARTTQSLHVRGSPVEDVDRREALVSPTPSAKTFRVNVPRGGRFVFSEGASEGVAFVVSVLARLPERPRAWREIHRHVVPAEGSDRWTEVSLDLSAYTGQDITLRLATEAPSKVPRRASPIASWGNPVILGKGASRIAYNVLWIAVDAPRSESASLDDVAKRGVRFTEAHASATWARGGVLAMLAGTRASEVGDSTLAFAGDVLRHERVSTRAFVETDSVIGPADLGFEAVIRRRRGVAQDAIRWMEENADRRFFAFVNVQNEREAVAESMRVLDAAGLRETTIVVVAGSQGEAPSSRVPIVVAAPGLLSPGLNVTSPVRTIDLAPTILELVGVEPHPRTSGTSLLGLANGLPESQARVVVTEGRGSRAIEHGRWHLVAREDATHRGTGGIELFDVADDPGERHDLAPTRPDMVDEMKARLDAALANVPVTGADHADPEPSRSPPPVVRLRFAGGGAQRRVSGAIVLGDATTKPKSYEVRPVDLDGETLRDDHGRVDLAFRTSAARLVGFDIVVDPPTTPITWQLWLDDTPWPADGVFAGTFGLATPRLLHGLAASEARMAAQGSALPPADARSEVGLFVVREGGLARPARREVSAYLR